jgi:hypothetical protein
VWFDIPVANLDRAASFYRAVLAIRVDKETFGETSFCVLEHGDAIGGCLVLAPDEVAPDRGILLYLNVDGRIRDAVAQAGANGGQVVEPIHAIGPHGFRAIVSDSEGNRIALHSASDR